MPLSKKEFAAIVQALGPDAPEDLIIQTARQAEKIRPPKVGDPLQRGLISAADRIEEIYKGLLGVKELPKQIGTKVGEYIKSLTPEDIATSRPMKDLAAKAAEGVEELTQHPYSTASKAIDATVLPHRKAVEQIHQGDVAEGVGRLGADAGLALLGALAGGKGLSDTRGLATASGRTGLSDQALAEAAVAHTADSLAAPGATQGGATINRFDGSLLGKPRFAVSTHPDRTLSTPELTNDVVKDFILKNSDLLDQKQNSLGVWAPKGENYEIDVVKTPKSLINAVRSGKKANQKAIFDLGRGREIDLSNPTLKILLNEGLIGDLRRRFLQPGEAVDLSRTGAEAVGAGEGAAAPSGILPESSPTPLPASAGAAGAGNLSSPQSLSAQIPAVAQRPRIVKLEHRSSVPNLTFADPEFYGTSGRLNSEMKRREAFPEHWVNRIYMTRSGEPFEENLMREKYLYEAEIPEDKIYDLGVDPENLWETAYEASQGMPAIAPSLMEEMLKNRDYWGYYNSTLPERMRSAVALFRKVPVKFVGPNRPHKRLGQFDK